MRLADAHAWDARLRELHEHVERSGDLPRGSEGAEGDLAAWLQRQRIALKAPVRAVEHLRAGRLDELIPEWRNSTGGLDSRWMDRANRVLAFFVDTGRLPHWADAEHDGLVKWLRAQQLANEAGVGRKWGPARRRWLDDNLPGWSEPIPTPAWVAKAELHASVLADPTAHGGSRSNAYVWLRRQARRDDLGDVREDLLDDLVPGWRTLDKPRSTRHPTSKRLEQLRVWVEQEGRRPRRRSDDPQERSLAQWLRSASAKADPRVTALLDGADAPVLRQSFIERTDELARHVRAHGRPPSRSDADPDVRALYAWMIAQRNRFANDTSPAGLLHQQHLDEHVPAWRGRVALEERWQERAQAVGDFLSTRGYPPSRAARTVWERRLAVWLERQRFAARSADPPLWWTRERAEFLDTHAPGWDPTRSTDPAWLKALQRVRKHLARTGAPPSLASTDRGERRLALWLDAQQHAPLSEAQRATLSTDVPGWGT